MPVGLLGALELVTTRRPRRRSTSSRSAPGIRCRQPCASAGLFIRNMGDRIAICPPLIINATELADLFDRLRQAFDAALADIKADGHFKG